MLACVNVDLDSLELYRKIHGLNPRNNSLFILKKAILRFFFIFSELKIPATFFIVGKDTKDKEIESIVKEMVVNGHEIANHSWSHPYNLIKMNEKSLKNEILLAHQRLSEIYGKEVKGFRAPGYNINKKVLNILSELNYLYDSSILPSPFYYFTRGIIISAMRVFGKKSSSILGRMADFFRREKVFKWEDGIFEIPISVFSSFKIPFIGTTIGCLGKKMLLKILTRVKKKPFINLEFHAIDLLCFEDGVERELRIEPVLRVSLSKRIEKISMVLEEIKKSHRILTLMDFVESLKN